MRTTTIENENEIVRLVKTAARVFSANKGSLFTYTENKIDGSDYIALRWGAGGDCVLILKIDRQYEPTIFEDLRDEQ